MYQRLPGQALRYGVVPGALAVGAMYALGSVGPVSPVILLIGLLHLAAIATFLTIGGAADRDLATADDTWDAAAHGGAGEAVGDGEGHTANQDVNRQRKVVLFAVSTLGLTVVALGLLLV
jgi:hypothetical protein